MLKRIVEQCKDCCLPDFSEGYCTAFDDPEYQHRGGRRCWGRCESIDEMVERLQAIISYNELHGLNTASVAKMRLELEDWEKMARVLKGGAEALRRGLNREEAPTWQSSRRSRWTISYTGARTCGDS